jgi:hypothetical protein
MNNKRSDLNPAFIEADIVDSPLKQTLPAVVSAQADELLREEEIKVDK